MENAFLCEVKKSETIIIYGCGEVGTLVQKELVRHGVKVKCFAVSQKEVNKIVNGIPVLGIEELLNESMEALFIVATKECFHHEIEQTLLKHDIKNRLFVTNELYCNMVSNRSGLYINAFHERSTHLQYKNSYCEKDDGFWERYFALIRNLDGESVQAVNVILNRMNALFKSEESEMDIFDENEKTVLKNIQIDFRTKIFQLDTKIFVYKNYLLPMKYFDINVYYYTYGCNLFQSFNKIIEGNIIDAGAYIGDSALLFAKMTGGKVYAWEAMRENCEYIKETVRLNGLNNLKIINKAVGGKSEKALIEKNDNLNWSTMKPYQNRDYGENNTVDMQSIDDFIEENKLEVSLIKLHVEGMESEAIRGAEKTLRTQKPALLIHIHHTPTDFFGIKPYIEELNLGYSFRVYKPVNGNVITGTMLLAEVV